VGGGRGAALAGVACSGLALRRVHAAPAIVPVAVEAVHQFMAQRDEALGVHFASRHGRIDGADTLAGGVGLVPLGAAADGEELRLAGELLAGGLRIRAPVPHHRDVIAWLPRAGAGGEEEERDVTGSAHRANRPAAERDRAAGRAPRRAARCRATSPAGSISRRALRGAVRHRPKTPLVPARRPALARRRYAARSHSSWR